MPLPPGPTYLIKNLGNIVVPPLLAFAVVKAIQHHRESFSIRVDVPTYALIIAMVFSFPLSLFLKTWIQDWKDKREAKRHGAVLPPIVKSRWPAGLDLLLNGIKRAPTEYTGISLLRVLILFELVKTSVQAIAMKSWHNNMDIPSTSNFCSRTEYELISVDSAIQLTYKHPSFSQRNRTTSRLCSLVNLTIMRKVHIHC